MRKSLLLQLSGWYALSAFALVMLSTIFLYWSVQSALAVRDSQVIAQSFATFRSLLSADASARMAEWGERKYERIFVRIINDKNKLLEETPGLSAEQKQVFNDLAHKARFHSSAAQKFREGEFTFRAAATVFDEAKAFQKGSLVMIALDRTDEEHILAAFKRRLGIVFMLSLGACLFVGYRIARQGIRPVEKFTAMTQQIKPTHLNDRIDATDLPVEFLALANQFNDMLARLEKYIHRTAEFSSDIAHELRTPINNLVGELSVALRKPRSPKEYEEILGSSLEECQRINRIIESLLFIARSEQPSWALRKEMVDLATEMNEIASFYEPAAADKGLTLIKENLETIAIPVERTLFQRAIGNVISNALQYTPAGGEIHVSATQVEDQAQIQVRDTGMGISAEHLPKVFQRFYRIDHSRSKNSGGVGLGLPIVKSIVDIHGGRIKIESVPRQGTVVTILFPRCQ